MNDGMGNSVERSVSICQCQGQVSEWVKALFSFYIDLRLMTSIGECARQKKGVDFSFCKVWKPLGCNKYSGNIQRWDLRLHWQVMQKLYPWFNFTVERYPKGLSYITLPQMGEGGQEIPQIWGQTVILWTERGERVKESIKYVDVMYGSPL